MELCFTSHVRFYRPGETFLCTPGFAKLVEMVAPFFERVRLCVPVFSGEPEPEDAGEMKVPNVAVCPLPAYYSQMEQTALCRPVRLIRCLWRPISQSDVVFISLPNHLSFLVWAVSLVQRKPFAIRIAGNWPELLRMAFCRHNMPRLGRVVAGGYELALRLMVRSASVTLAHGKELADHYGRTNPRVVCVVSSTIQARDIADRIAASDSGECRILYAGRLIRDKGLPELFLAARDLQREGLKFRLVIAGDGNRRDEIKAHAERCELNGRVEFLGWVSGESLEELYRSVDVLVMPSYSETGPKVVIEAMARGLPVVATRVGSVPLTVEDGISGLIIPPRDSGAIRDALRRVITDEPLRRRMAAASLERARGFTLEAERECVATALRKAGLLPPV